MTSTTETRPDGSKHIVDWGSAGLRSTETYKDTDGTTTLQTASSSWVTGTYGKNVSVKDTVRYASSSQMATQETQEYDFLGNPTISLLYADGYWQSQTRRYYDYPGGQLFARLRRQESLQTQKEGKTYRSFTTDTVEYLYDEFALTDRGGAVLQQAPGYGPTYTTRHNPTTVRRYLASEDRWVNVARTYYDTVGNVVQKKDALNRIVETIQYSLDYAHAYPTQVTNALGHSSFTNYLVAGQPKSWSGLPVSTTDANNQTTSFQYDAMNRTSRVDAPNGAWETTSYNDTYFTERLSHDRHDRQEHRRHPCDERDELLRRARAASAFRALGRRRRGEPGGQGVRALQLHRQDGPCEHALPAGGDSLLD